MPFLFLLCSIIFQLFAQILKIHVKDVLESSDRDCMTAFEMAFLTSWLPRSTEPWSCGVRICPVTL